MTLQELQDMKQTMSRKELEEFEAKWTSKWLELLDQLTYEVGK